MNIICLDMEGVLTPEIWIEFARESGIPELKRTTRDEPDYDKLMKWRMGILREHGLGLKEIQETISAQIKDLNKKLVAYKQIRIIEFRSTEFEKTTSRKIKRHVVK